MGASQQPDPSPPATDAPGLRRCCPQTSCASDKWKPQSWGCVRSAQPPAAARPAGRRGGPRCWPAMRASSLRSWANRAELVPVAWRQKGPSSLDGPSLTCTWVGGCMFSLKGRVGMVLGC